MNDVGLWMKRTTSGHVLRALDAMNNSGLDSSPIGVPLIQSSDESY